MEDFVHLVQNAQSGSLEAFAMLVARFQNMAYSYAYTILGDFDRAQDAVQEAFVEVYQVLPTLREPFAFPAWLKRIVFKYCDRQMRRKNYQTVPLENVEETVFPQPGPQELVERKEISYRLNKALHVIPANLRTVAILFYIGEYSHQEIADFLDVPVKTVKSRLHASRQRLKERMLDMVHDEFKHNPLPDQFTRETLEQALQRAAELNKDHHYDEAEKLLRSVLAQVPEHPIALKELNQSIMKGQVYGQGRWDLLRELADQGKMILKTNDDNEIHLLVAQTLLAIPAMLDGISFLESWIAEKGPTLERLGMLAWAKGCQGDFASALVLWDKLISQALTMPGEQVQKHVPFFAFTLVNCFSAAGEFASAQAIAKQAWEICNHQVSLSMPEPYQDDIYWLSLWHQANLDLNEIAPILLALHPENTELPEQAAHLAVRGWLEPPTAVTEIWLKWANDCITSENYPLLEKYRLVILQSLRARDLWPEANQLAGCIWELLGNLQTPKAQRARVPWDWERFNPVGAIEAKNWQEAQKLVLAEIAARGVQGAVGWAAIVAGGCGKPTPPEILQALEENGVSKVDEYGMFGWYLVAREAAHAGNLEKAFDALRKALSYWSNPPYWITDLWEKDTYWGNVREHQEFRQAFEQRRQKIGTIHGQLQYFPGW